MLGEGDFVEVENTGSEKLHFVVIAGQPLSEPVVQHGKLGDYTVCGIVHMEIFRVVNLLNLKNYD